MNCIYSYWLSKPVLPGACAGAAAMQAYARRIGADFRFLRHDPYTNRFGVEARWFDKLRPCFDPAFQYFDKVAVVDSDVFPVAGLTQNIFEEPCGDFAMAEEPDQPAMRAVGRLFTTELDRRWANFCRDRWDSVIPCDEHNRPRTWNAGVIVLHWAGRQKIAHGITATMAQYHRATRQAGFPAQYCTEQGYLNMLAFSPTFLFSPLSVEWNRQIHRDPRGGVYDRRTDQTRFVHVMLPGADHHDAAWHDAIVNSKPNGQDDRCGK